MQLCSPSLFPPLKDFGMNPTLPGVNVSFSIDFQWIWMKSYTSPCHRAELSLWASSNPAFSWGIV